MGVLVKTYEFKFTLKEIEKFGELFDLAQRGPFAALYANMQRQITEQERAAQMEMAKRAIEAEQKIRADEREKVRTAKKQNRVNGSAAAPKPEKHDDSHAEH